MRGLVEYGGDYAGAYLLRRGLFLPFELKAVIDPQLVREGLQTLRPLDRLRATMQPDPGSAVGRVAALESQNYMRNQLLRDSDWAGMAHSLEIRTPLVDVDLLQVLAPVVPHLGATVGKVALGGAPSLALPDEIVNRPKTGFAVPTGRWLAQSVGAPIARKGAASRVWASRVFAEAGGGRP
jgi:asparagine synthase (glutamine-hydrolysing)